MSSGDVSNRTRIVSCIIPFNLSASSAEKTTLPLAAPGDAGSPEAITSFFTLSSKVGCNNVSKVFGSIRSIASFFDINFSYFN